MKKLSKVIAITAVVAMSFSCLSTYAAEMPESTKMVENRISQKVNWDGERTKINREEFAAAIESGEFDGIAGKRGGRTSFGGNRIELSDEQKTERIEKIAAELTEKLQAGEITQEEYDEVIAKIEVGDFMRGGKDGKGMKGGKPEKVEMNEEEKAAKIEELKADLAEKLEAGEITQEEYDEVIAEIEAGDFIRGGKDGRGMKGEKPEKVEMTEEEKTAKIEELKTDLAAKLEAGEITQEEYDEKLAKIESGDFRLDSKGGRGIKDTKRTKKANDEINSVETVIEA